MNSIWIFTWPFLIPEISHVCVQVIFAITIMISVWSCVAFCVIPCLCWRIFGVFVCTVYQGLQNLKNGNQWKHFLRFYIGYFLNKITNYKNIRQSFLYHGYTCIASWGTCACFCICRGKTIKQGSTINAQVEGSRPLFDSIPPPT